jgi:prepilin-type N-terminal cleavage/methylation domain-containing protein
MKRSAFSVIEILVVVAILLILMAVLLPRYIGGKDAVTGKKIASPKQRAQQVQGVSYSSQISQAITMYKMDHDEQPPPSLSELTRYGITSEMLIEPVSKKPYGYNPQTGQLSNPF